MRVLFLTTLIISCFYLSGQIIKKDMKDSDKTIKTEEQWEKELTPEQYTILRECGTEPPFTGKYYNYDKKGIYHCTACGAKLFNSAAVGSVSRISTNSCLNGGNDRLAP